VLEQTEALVAIDVNSGKYRDEEDLEATALKTNLEAAQEIARQLRLRDLGGVIVNDFIDMESEPNRRAVERALRVALKRDRAKSWISRISRFGIIEMTRQRVRPSFERSNHEPCKLCRGTGVVKSARSAGHRDPAAGPSLAGSPASVTLARLLPTPRWLITSSMIGAGNWLTWRHSFRRRS
jgi:ribonuclease E